MWESVVDEMNVPVLVLFKRTRPFAALIGFAFHIISQLIFSIGFMSLWLCYVGLFYLRPLARRYLKTKDASSEDSPLSPWPLSRF